MWKSKQFRTVQHGYLWVLLNTIVYTIWIIICKYIYLYLATENSFKEIIQKENIHKSEFESIISHMEKNISELKLCIEDSKLVANTLWVNRFYKPWFIYFT